MNTYLHSIILSLMFCVETVMHQGDNDVKVDSVFNYLIYIDRDWYKKEDHDFDGYLVYIPPPIHDERLDEQGCHDKICGLEQQRQRREDRIRERNHAIPVPDIIPLSADDNDITPVEDTFSNDNSDSDYSVGPLISESKGEIDAGNSSPDFNDTPATPPQKSSALEGAQSGPEKTKLHSQHL